MVFLESVEISENIFLSGSPIFFISRLFGTAPFEIKIFNSSYKLFLSAKYIFFSYIFGIILISATIFGAICDTKLGPDSLKMTSTKKICLTYFDIFIVLLIIFFGIFSAPFKAKFLWKVLETLKEVDSITANKNGKVYRQSNLLYLNSVLLFVIGLLIFDLCVEDSEKIQNYLVFYFLYIIVYIIASQYSQIVLSITRRFKKLNECFETEKFMTNFLMKSVLSNNRIITVSQTIKEKINSREDLFEYISNLSLAHSKLYEMVDRINDGYGFLVLIIIVSCLFHLVTTPYFLLSDMLEKNSSISELILQFLWVLAHLIRLLIVVEPCQTACDEALVTNSLVAKLLTSELDNCYKTKLQLFSLQLVHREIEFTAFGLCKINRSLLSTITGAVTTYLVILLQFR